MSQTSHNTDVVIIGAGPVGLFAVFECGMLNMECHVIDALDMVGGQCKALYPEKPIYDIPGYPCVLAAELIHNLEKQIEPFSPVYHLTQQVQKIQRAADGRWDVETSGGVKINAQAIIIAAGVGAFGPNRPPLEGIENYEGNGVQYFVKSRENFRDKKVVIAGGGDSALDWALSLQEVAKSITVVHRRNKFRGAPENVAKLYRLVDEGRIDLVVPYQLSGLQGNGNKLEAVIVKNLDDHERVLPAEFLLPFFGLSMNLGPIAEWGLNLDQKHITIDPSTSVTSEPGIFAIGDVATYSHKLKLIMTGFAEAAQAAYAIRKLVFPDESFHFEYSTTQGAPWLKSGKPTAVA